MEGQAKPVAEWAVERVTEMLTLAWATVPL